MPRASWKGFLRLSLVSCPVYLSPATTRTKAVRLHQVWVPGSESRRAKPADVAEAHDQPQIRGGDHDNGSGLLEGCGSLKNWTTQRILTRSMSRRPRLVSRS